MTDKANEVQTSNSKKLNGLTITAIVMASTSILIDPLGIISILGIIFSAIGLAHSSSSRNKTWAIMMLGLSIVETIVWVAVMASALAAL